jgi:N-acetyl-anhydromuramyl-L-alanine amidase AmpD
MSLDTSKIKQVPFSESQYYKEVTEKKQIVLHHTAGNSSGIATIQNWNTDDRGRIATCVTISGPGNKQSPDGEICQAYSSTYWAYHLGIKQEVFRARKLPQIAIDKHAIGIEICNWGQLEKVGDKYINYVDREVPADQVTKLDTPYKGYTYFHRYSDAQIESVKNLLIYWRDQYKINLTFNYDQCFTVNNTALTGVNGLYTHNSYRKDKVDIYPCPRMISMLKTL